MDNFFDVNARGYLAPVRLDRGRARELAELASKLDMLVVRLDGQRMESQGDLFCELKEKLEFPDYFGGNWNALDECLADLDWLDATGYLLLIDAGDSVLCAEDRQVREMFYRLLGDISVEWAEQTPPVLFRTILVV